VETIPLGFAAIRALYGLRFFLQVNGTGGQAGGLQSLSSFRYAPYPVPSALAANQAAVQQAQALLAQQQQQTQASQAPGLAPSQPAQHSAAANPAHSLATTMSLASNAAIPTMSQAAHLTAVLPTVSLGGGGSLASPTSAATANQLAAAAAANQAVAGGGPNPYQVSILRNTFGRSLRAL
jgi:hypothetical protein